MSECLNWMANTKDIFLHKGIYVLIKNFTVVVFLKIATGVRVSTNGKVYRQQMMFQRMEC